MKNGEIMTGLNLAQIQAIIPHREPFILVDEVVSCTVGQKITALRHVTGQEDFFRGHFPGMPVMPGVLQLEAMAQAGAISVLSLDAYRGRIALFAAADKVKFRRQVTPGDVLKLEVEMLRLSKVAGRGRGVASVDGEITCEGEITFVFAKDKD